MDGYATLDHAQFSGMLERAIPRLEKRAAALKAEDLEIRQEDFDRRWAKRTWLFGPWTEQGCRNRVSDGMGLFGSTSAQLKLWGVERLLEQYRAQAKALDGRVNGEPYLVKLKEFNLLQGWAS